MFQFRRILLPITVFFSTIQGYSQDQPVWDNTHPGDWPRDFKLVKITSTLDQNLQPAIAYFTQDPDPKPLIVSLHTWSGGYDQIDPLAVQCLERGYNYIHPHFRGPNNTFDACGSEKVIQDIDDAISFAIQNGNIDTAQIHIIGVSGGGYATLLMYMRTNHNIRTFSAWAPISNLIDWYRESEARNNKYGKDIARATTGINFDDKYYLDTLEAIKRSPIFMETPVGQRKNSKLFLFTGIHDGYTGSVPITHTLLFYNKIVKSFDPIEANPISEKDIITMLASRSFENPKLIFIGERKIHYQKNHEGLIHITIFEGSHELLERVALDHIDSKKILTIGDSNGATNNRWVD